jgi:transposase
MTNVTPGPGAEPEWAAFVAIDWGDRKNFWKLAVAGSEQREKGEMGSEPEEVDAWATGLAVRFGDRPIAVILEQSRGALIYKLVKYAHLVLFPVHSATAARYRKAFHPSGSKSDPGDADSLLDLLLRHREELRELRPDNVPTRLLRILVEQRREMVDDSTRYSNRLTSCLKMYFPQVLKWFDRVSSPMVCAFVQRWPTLQRLRGAHPGTLRKFFLEHNCRSEELIRTRIAEVRTAVAATNDEAVIEGESLTALGLIGQIEALRLHIDALDRRIREVVQEHPDGSLFSSFPGAGEALAPRLIAAFGSDRARYSSAEEVQHYSGIAPVTETSGRKKWVHFRRACPKFLRQTFQEFAQHSMHKSEWAKAFYRSEREKGQKHHCAVRKLAYKWIRILFRCWKNGTPYDEAVYQRSLEKRRPAMKAALPPATTGEWKNVAGFQKFSVNPS